MKANMQQLLEENELLKNKLDYYQSYDPLTGLFNKEAFCHKAEQLLQQYPNVAFQIIGFDIEHFKLVNDYFGTECGDALLKYVADELKKQITDEKSLTARFVADIFMILLPCTYDNQQIGSVLLDICNKAPVEMDILPAIGIYKIEDNIAISRMCDRANMASNSIKGYYMKHLATYDDSMRNILIEEQELLSGLEDSLHNHEFEIYMQPKCNMYTGKITGAEALVRWNHPQKGMISPKDFIPIFERNGFIKKLDQYVWQETARWLQKCAKNGNKILPISVNLSRIDIISMDVVGYMDSLVEKFKLDPRWLELEVTESAYSARSEEIIVIVDRLMQKGFTVLMDDFGSGYSSLNMLKDINIDVLKLDMRFLDNHDRKSKDILESVVHMAKWLNLKVIAEGVENREQVEFLLGIGCTYAQGFYYYKPMPLKEFEVLLCDHEKVDYEDKGNADIQKDILRFKDLFHGDTVSELLLDNILGAVVLYEYEGEQVNIVTANEKYYQLMGNFARNHENVLHFVEEKNREMFLQAFTDAKNNGTHGVNIKFKRLHNEKGSIWLQLRLFFFSDINNKEIFYGSLSDVSADMQTMEELWMSKKLFQIAMDASRDTIFELDINTRVATYSMQSKDAFGLNNIVANAPEGFIEQNTVCEGYEDAFREVYNAIYRGEDRSSCVIKAHMGDNTTAWNRITLISLKDSNGMPIKAVGLVENITKEVELQEQLDDQN